MCFSNRQPSNLTWRHNECTLATCHALLQPWMCIIWVWIQRCDTMSLLPALSAWVSSPESLMREVGDTLTAVMTRRPPHRDTQKGVNHYVVYTEETPALPHWAHAGENPAIAATIIFFFYVCSNITSERRCMHVCVGLQSLVSTELYLFLIWIGPVVSTFSRSTCYFINLWPHLARKSEAVLSALGQGHFCRGSFFKTAPCNKRDTACM